jgi:hypothetical protein
MKQRGEDLARQLFTAGAEILELELHPSSSRRWNDSSRPRGDRSYSHIFSAEIDHVNPTPIILLAESVSSPPWGGVEDLALYLSASACIDTHPIVLEQTRGREELQPKFFEVDC